MKPKIIKKSEHEAGLPEKVFYTPQEVATYFNVTLQTVYNWIVAGKLESVKIAGTVTRIPQDSVLAIQVFRTGEIYE